MKSARTDIFNVAINNACLETLEHRQMLSSVSLDSGVVKVAGLAKQANWVTFKTSGDQLRVAHNGKVSSFKLANVRSISVTGGEKDDYVEMQNGLAIPIKVVSGAGNDKIIGGMGNDTLDSGAGNDTITGSGGNDLIHAGAGNDFVYAGRGNDSIDGGAGNDLLYGDDGDDTFYNVDAGDRVIGGYGRDTIDPSTPVDENDEGDGAPNTGGVRFAGFTLINADTNKVVSGYESLKNNTVLDLSKLPAKLTIRANLDGGAAVVVFDYDNQKNFRREGAAPYALASDTAGKYHAMNFTLGTHTLGASVFDGSKLLDNGSIQFNVIRSATNSTPTPAPTPVPTPTPAPTPVPTTPSTPNQTPTTPTNINPVVTPAQDYNASAAKPTAKITAIGTSVPAGTAVHVDALASKLGSGDWQEAQYFWDFGDSGTRFNQLKGFNAAHVYDKAGTYTVTLTIMNKAGQTHSTAIQVNVTPAARKVIYVSTSGSDSNNGLSQNTPVKSFAKAFSMVGDNTEILFKRGETFTTSSSAWIGGQNVVIGAYGIGDRPVIKWNGARNSSVIFSTGGAAKNVTVQDLTIDSIFAGDTNDAGVPLAMRPTGENITMRRNQLLNLMYGMNLNMQPDGILVQDNVAPSATGIRKYFVWAEGSHIVIAGNTVANSTREHIVRVNLASKILVTDNNFTNLTRENVDQWDYKKPALNIQSGEFAYAANNRLDGPLHLGPLGSGAGAEYMERRFKYLIVEGNDVINDIVQINHGLEYTTLRHNTFRANGFAGITIDAYNTEYGRGVVNLTLHNNTGINTGEYGSFLRLQGAAKNIRLVDNVYLAPNLTVGARETAALKIDQNDLSSFSEINGNVWPVAKSVLSWVGEQAMNYIGADYVKGFQTASEWNGNSKVGTDVFTNLSIGSTGHLVSGRLVGAKAA